MREVYRRSDVALWTTLFCLPIAVVSGLVVALTGADWSTQGGMIGGLFGGGTALLLVHGLGFKRQGHDPGTRIAPAAAMRGRLLRRNLIAVAAIVALLAAVSDPDVLCWWYVPCFYTLAALSSALGWAYLTRWERRHPGEIPVTDFAAWRADSYVWLTDPGAEPPQPRTARGWRWLLSDR